jgi:hypothetical protein
VASRPWHYAVVPDAFTEEEIFYARAIVGWSGSLKVVGGGGRHDPDPLVGSRGVPRFDRHGGHLRACEGVCPSVCTGNGGCRTGGLRRNGNNGHRVGGPADVLTAGVEVHVLTTP